MHIIYADERRNIFKDLCIRRKIVRIGQYKLQYKPADWTSGDVQGEIINEMMIRII